MFYKIDKKLWILYVTGPAKTDHLSTKKLPIFSVFAVS